jgi:YD repeat-containing protein
VTTAHTDFPGTDQFTDADGVQRTFPFASKDVETDPLGHTTTKRYDALHRLVSLTNAENRTKQYEYDGENLTKESNFKGQFTQYRYDSLNRVTEIIDRLNQLTTISYSDANGLTRTITDRRGNQRVEVYDQMQRLLSVAQGGQPLMSNALTFLLGWSH